MEFELDTFNSDEFGLIDDQSAIVTFTSTLSALNWREYLETKWEKIQRGLVEVKLLIICGVHGGSDGRLEGDAHNVDDCKRQAVSLIILHPVCSIKKLTHRGNLHTLK